MTLISNAFTTFSVVGNREDLADKIYDISPLDCPFVGSIGKSKASHTHHEWQIDALAAAGSNAQLEGDEIAAAASTATSRLANDTQILYKACGVSETQNAANPAGRAKEMVYQLLKRSRELKRDIEWAMLNNQTPIPDAHPSNPGGGTASTTTARVLRPVNAWITTNDDGNLRGSGGSGGSSSAAATDASAANLRPLTEDMLKEALRKSWNQGGQPDLVICGPVNKQNISGFAGNATRYINASDRLKAAITYYEHDFGVIKVMPDRFSRDRDVWVLDTNYWAVATYRPMRTEDLARIGDATRGYVVTELTLESRNEASSAVIADLTTS